MDIQELLNPSVTPDEVYLVPLRPVTPKQKHAPFTTRSDRIRIKTAVEWGATPKRIFAKYGYTLNQVRLAKVVTTPSKRRGRPYRILHAKVV